MQAIGREEDRFSRTLSAASQRLDRLINREQAAGSSNLSGEIAFELYDTYGLPLELTNDHDPRITLSASSYLHVIYNF